MREKEITTRMIPALEKKYGSSEVYEFEGKKYLSLGDPYLDSVWINNGASGSGLQLLCPRTWRAGG